MNTKLLRRLAVLATAVGVLVPASSAVAAPFDQTFRGESRLCDRAAAGDLRGNLQGDEAGVLAACAALHAAYDQAAAAADAARADLDARIAAARDDVAANCARRANRQACNAARMALVRLAVDRFIVRLDERRALNEAAGAFASAVDALRTNATPPPPPPPPPGPVINF